MWNCSIDLLGKIVIFEPGIAFPFQTLARGSHDSCQDELCITNNIPLFLLVVTLFLGFLSLSLAGVSCVRGSDSCVRPSKRLKLAFVLRSRRRNFVLGF